VVQAGNQAEYNLTKYVRKARQLRATWTAIGQALGAAASEPRSGSAGRVTLNIQTACVLAEDRWGLTADQAATCSVTVAPASPTTAPWHESRGDLSVEYGSDAECISMLRHRPRIMSAHAADRVRGEARGAEQAFASGLIGNGGTQRRPELPGSGEEAFRHEGMRANHR
jgi:hypothetical protein